MPAKKPPAPGKRPRGRPALRPPGLITTSVDLTEQEREHLRQVGGNVQAGVVRLVQESMSRNPQ